MVIYVSPPCGGASLHFYLHEISQEYCLHWSLLIGESCPRYISVFILIEQLSSNAYLTCLCIFSFLHGSCNKCIWIKDKKQDTWLNN